MHKKDLAVLKTAQLTAQYAVGSDADSPVFFYINTSPSIDWSLTYKEVEEILRSRNVSVNEHSDKSNCGLFQIGSKYNWYYLHGLFDTPEALENEIYKLLVYSVTG